MDKPNPPAKPAALRPPEKRWRMHGGSQGGQEAGDESINGR